MTDLLHDSGVQGLAQLGRNAIERVAELERTIADLQMRLRRAGQLLIAEIGAGGPENADDTAERAAGVIRKQASQLSNLLAVIHGDGGHYESERGTERACADAETVVSVLRGRMGGFQSSANEWRQRAEQAEARLSAIDAAPVVAVVREMKRDFASGPHKFIYYDSDKLPACGTELIAKPAKEST